MGVLAIVFLACAVLVVIGAEWPRIETRVGAPAWSRRSRARRKRSFTVIEGEQDDDFAESVKRDLANLPVLGDPEDRSRR
jgi:hypothetical protein